VASQHINVGDDSLSLSAATADKLITRRQSDAALLYLYLLRHRGYLDPEQAEQKLGWTRVQLDSALSHLRELELIAGGDQPQFTSPAPRADQAPTYTATDVNEELRDTGSAFRSLLGEVEIAFGKRLSPSDTRILLEIFDHVALPAEVIYQLVMWQIQEYEDKHGPGRRPRMSVIRSAAYRWKESGVDSLETAEAYLKKLEYYRSQEGELLAAVGITGRKAANGERKYLNAWTKMGFPAETVALACDRTMTNTGAMKWPYCNAILKRWHGEGHHTLSEVTAAQQRPNRPHKPNGQGAKAPVPAAQCSVSQADKEREILENERWMRDFLKHQQDQS
jgi:DnaD/phage-associated family protein